MPVTASIVGASIGGAQTAFGAYQYLQGRQMAKKAKRPEMDIPREISDKLSTAQMMALEGMSAQERSKYIDNLQRVANFQMSEMGTRKAGLVGAAELGQTQADAVRNLAVESEKMRRENQRYLGATQSEMAGWKQQQFQANKMQPYMAQVTAAQAMQGAGLQNIWGGASSAAKNLSSAAMYSSLDTAKTANTDGLKSQIKFTPPTLPTDQEMAQQAIDLGGQRIQNQMTDEEINQALGRPSAAEAAAINNSIGQFKHLSGNMGDWQELNPVEAQRRYKLLTDKEAKNTLSDEEKNLLHLFRSTKNPMFSYNK